MATEAVLTKDDVVSVAEFAEALGRAEITVRQWIGSGVIPSMRVDNRRFIRRDVLDAMVNRTAISAPRPHEWETAEEFIRLNRPDLG